MKDAFKQTNENTCLRTSATTSENVNGVEGITGLC